MSTAASQRVYLVTGGGGHIAQAVLRRFAEGGCRLVSIDRRARPLPEGIEGLSVAADLTTPAGAVAAVVEARDRFGHLDGLIHTVGGFLMGPLAAATNEDYDRMFDLNVRTLFFSLRAVLPHLIARGEGFVAGISSEPGWTGAAPGMALYGAAKAAMATMLRSLEGEVRGHGVRVAIVYPMGAVDTPPNRTSMPDLPPSRLIDPGEIAEALWFAATRGGRGSVTELPIHPGPGRA